MVRSFFLLIFLIGYGAPYSSNRLTAQPVDSTLNALPLMKEDTTKVNLLIKTGNYFNKSHPDSAIAFYKQGLELSERIGYIKGTGKALNHLGVLYTWMMRYHDAIEVNLRAKVLLALELGKSTIENKLSQERLDASEKIRHLLNEQVQQQERELTTMAMEILNKKEILESIGREMKVDNAELSPDQLQRVKKVQGLIAQNLNVQDQWKNFRIHLERVHPGFFNRLVEKYPSLNHNDLKLCAYLYLALSTKEIAGILSIIPASVDIKRNRLRKKLSLSSGVNLAEFLRQI
jgi:DNA-binding CsgD family transcriptional regulator